jgi:dimethylhistidine N-methyltransferase
MPEFSDDIRTGLSAKPKHIKSCWLYDDVGSALFDAICNLKEYECTRAEKRLLREFAHQIKNHLAPNAIAVELGGGNGDKAKILLSASDYCFSEFHNIDISPSALDTSRTAILSLLSDDRMARKYGNQGLPVYCHQADFLRGMSSLASRQEDGRPMLVMFLGSSIGNFETQASLSLLTAICRHLREGDFLLLGTDLIKESEKLLMAYDDPQGVTAAFNKNLLARINYQLGANFDLSRFRHEARWNASLKRVEMHLVSTCHQIVDIPGAEMVARFEEHESTHTENSYKYDANDVILMMLRAGFSVAEQWVDEVGRFATTLASVAREFNETEPKNCIETRPTPF